MGDMIDVSIIIVHAFAREKLRQTLRGIRRAAPQMKYEIIIVDNTPEEGFVEVIDNEFSEIKYISMPKNVGFGAGMNRGIQESSGRYIFIFNPDIIVKPGSIEGLMKFMDENTDIGICGPKLVNPDGTLQYSCYRLPTWLLPVYRRTPLGRLPAGKRAVSNYLMMHESHDEMMDVDSLIGGALFTRRKALNDVGLFDEQFFIYYEDNDLCRRFWESGHRIVYYPHSEMMHYHRRQTADGNLFRQLTSKITWIQISSFIKYMRKYHKKPNPRIILSDDQERNAVIGATMNREV